MIGAPTIDGDVANTIHPISFECGMAIILAQKPAQVSQDGVALREYFPIQLDDWHLGSRIYLRNEPVLRRFELFLRVPYIIECDFCVEEK